MKNQIASTFKVVAWVTYISGLLAGIILANQPIAGHTYLNEFVFTIALTYWVGAFISGTIFLGIGEIIELLQKLVDKEYGVSANPVNVEKVQSSEQYYTNEEQRLIKEKKKEKYNSMEDILNDQEIVDQAKEIRRIYGEIAYENFLKGKAKELGINLEK